VLGAAAFALCRPLADEGPVVGQRRPSLGCSDHKPSHVEIFAIASNYPKTAMAHAALIAIFQLRCGGFWPVGGSSAGSRARSANLR
jgi:hypothetical protein